MTVGSGLSIGSVNSVVAVKGDDSGPQTVAVWRTTASFDTAGGLELGSVPRSDSVIADFADLVAGRDPVAMVAGRAVSGAELVAAMTDRLLAAAGVGPTPSVLAYPAIYSGDQLSALRQALDRVGRTGTRLLPEPLAAAAWLGATDRTTDRELVLVYDLGASSLDLAVVRIDTDATRLVGRPLRSYDFGGRPFGLLLASYLHDLAPDTAPPRTGLICDAEVAELCARQVRESVALVLDCVGSADITMREIDRVLLIGGAAHSVQVAQVLADELGRPVVRGPEPAQTVALGAALLAAAALETSAGAVIAVPHRRPIRLALMAAAVISIWAAIPAGLLLARTLDRGVDAPTAESIYTTPRFDPFSPTPGTTIEVYPVVPSPGGAHIVEVLAVAPRISAEVVDGELPSESSPTPPAQQPREPISDEPVAAPGTADFPDIAAVWTEPSSTDRPGTGSIQTTPAEQVSPTPSQSQDPAIAPPIDTGVPTAEAPTDNAATSDTGSVPSGTATAAVADNAATG